MPAPQAAQARSASGGPRRVKGFRPRPVSQRTCVGCRTTTAKRGLVRVVRTPAGSIEIDPTGKRSGRGGYLCRNRSCWEEALKKKRLDQALKMTLPPEAVAVLRRYLEALPPAAPETPPSLLPADTAQAGAATP